MLYLWHPVGSRITKVRIDLHFPSKQGQLMVQPERKMDIGQFQGSYSPIPSICLLGPRESDPTVKENTVNGPKVLA